jgi:mRNA interferase MazF
MRFTQGDLLLVTLVFSDGSGAKRRPVMVVYDSGDEDLLVAPVTSHPLRSIRDVALARWQEAGLRLPSCVRLEKLATVAKSTMIRSLGKLPPDALAQVKTVLKQYFADVLAE